MSDDNQTQELAAPALMLMHCVAVLKRWNERTKS